MRRIIILLYLFGIAFVCSTVFANPRIAALWSEWLVNRSYLSFIEQTAKHDLFWTPPFDMRFQMKKHCVLMLLSLLLLCDISFAGKPSIFAAWSESLINRSDLSFVAQTVKHDVFWSPEFGMRFVKTPEGIALEGDFQAAREKRNELLGLNRDMLFILEIHIRGADPNSWYLKGLYTDDFP